MSQFYSANEIISSYRQIFQPEPTELAVRREEFERRVKDVTGSDLVAGENLLREAISELNDKPDAKRRLWVMLAAIAAVFALGFVLLDTASLLPAINYVSIFSAVAVIVIFEFRRSARREAQYIEALQGMTEDFISEREDAIAERVKLSVTLSNARKFARVIAGAIDEMPQPMEVKAWLDARDHVINHQNGQIEELRRFAISSDEIIRRLTELGTKTKRLPQNPPNRQWTEDDYAEAEEKVAAVERLVQENGLTVTVACQRTDIPKSTYYDYKKRLSQN